MVIKIAMSGFTFTVFPTISTVMLFDPARKYLLIFKVASLQGSRLDKFNTVPS